MPMRGLRQTIVTMLLAGSLADLAGCVQARDIPPTVLNRYQQALADRPRPPRGDKGLEPYVPAPWTKPPTLPVEKTAEGCRIHLALSDAVMRTLANSVEIQVVSYDPAIARQDAIAAAAAFDYVLAGGYSLTKNDNRPNSTFGGGMSDIRTYEIGIREHTITGADWSLAYSLTRTWDNNQFGNIFSTRYEPKLLLEVTQPLLRDAWPAFNLAKLRIAEITHNRTEAQFRQTVQDTVTQVITNYWALLQARQEVVIQEELLQRTIETWERIKSRRDLDATEVEQKQAESAVAIRRAGLIAAKKLVWDTQDQLARLLGDSQINAINPCEIVPDTPPNVSPLTVDAADQLVSALEHNPTLEQARLSIALADVNVLIAKNQALPRLDFKGSAQIQNLAGSESKANEDFWSGDFFSYSAALSFEYPIGNRERLAQLRGRKYDRLKAIAAMQNVADQLAVIVKERTRQIYTSFQEMKAQAEAVKAARIQLDALEATERIRGTLSPSFLQTKLSAQETLANAQRGELQAIVQYNTAISQLAQATGTILETYGIQLALPTIINRSAWPAPPTNATAATTVPTQTEEAP